MNTSIVECVAYNDLKYIHKMDTFRREFYSEFVLLF